MFFGYHLPAATMAAEDNGPPAPELARRMTLTSCRLDPARALVPVPQKMAAAGIAPGDITGDSGHAHRHAEAWAIPLRLAGSQLVQHLHPHDRGPHGTHHDAIIANGNLHRPQTPATPLQPGPLPSGAAPGDTAAHDQQTADPARHKPGRLTAGGADHRPGCAVGDRSGRLPRLIFSVGHEPDGRGRPFAAGSNEAVVRSCAKVGRGLPGGSGRDVVDQPAV